MICTVMDLLGCTNPEPAPDALVNAMREAAQLLGAQVLRETPVQFPVHGLTCVLVLAESHLTVSTWPEYRMVQVDLVTCRADIDPEQALRPIVDLLGSQDTRTQRVPRVDPRALPAAAG